MALRVETERLLIRGWTEDDIDPYADMASDPEVMRYIGNGEPRGRDYAEEFVRRMIRLHEERGWIRFAIEHGETGRFMGFCGYEMQDEVLDFGWRYARQFWGGGYGSEASLAVLGIGRETYGLTGIESQSYPENVGSIRIIEKLGMTYLRESVSFGRRIVHYGFPEVTPRADRP